jgi:hypothetical protein
MNIRGKNKRFIKGPVEEKIKLMFGVLFYHPLKTLCDEIAVPFEVILQ